jgi:hypothetical protein
MKKNKILIIVLISIIIILTGYLIINKNIKSKQFPPSNVECFNNFMWMINGFYVDDFHIPAFNLSDISYFRCASQKGFNQYEISGIDKEGHSFYIHKDQGGMASSGSDSVYNFCYKKDDIVMVNLNYKRNGRESIKQEGTCYWTDNFPSNPVSIYKYKK